MRLVLLLFLLIMLIMFLISITLNHTKKKKKSCKYYDKTIYFNTELEKYYKIIKIQKNILFKKKLYFWILLLVKKLEGALP